MRGKLILLPVKHLARDCPFGDEERSQRLKDRFIAGLWHEKMVASVFQKKFEDITFAKAVETAAVLEQEHVCIIVGQDLSVNAAVLNSPILVIISGTYFIPGACKQGIAGASETSVLSGLWWFTLSLEQPISECSVSLV